MSIELSLNTPGIPRSCFAARFDLNWRDVKFVRVSLKFHGRFRAGHSGAPADCACGPRGGEGVGWGAETIRGDDRRVLWEYLVLAGKQLREYLFRESLREYLFRVRDGRSNHDP